MQFNLGNNNSQTEQQNDSPKQLEQITDQSQSQSQNEKQEQVSSTTFSDESQPDWKNAPLPEEAEEVPEPPPTAQKDDVILNNGRYVISYEVFHKGFQKAFVMAGITFQLETLFKAAEDETCPDASRALYDIILETPSLQWIVRPESIWLQRVFAIGSFALPVAAGCVLEVKTKKAQAAQAQTNTHKQEGEENHADDTTAGRKESSNHWSEWAREEYPSENSV